MDNVISLSDYRASKGLRSDPEAALRQVRPLLDSDILGRDFGQFHDQIFAILKLRDIFDRHLHFSEEWKHYLLCLLSDVHSQMEEDVLASFLENIHLLKQYILEETTEENKRDMAAAFTLLELMRHARPREERLRH